MNKETSSSLPKTHSPEWWDVVLAPHKMTFEDFVGELEQQLSYTSLEIRTILLNPTSERNKGGAWTLRTPIRAILHISNEAIAIILAGQIPDYLPPIPANALVSVERIQNVLDLCDLKGANRISLAELIRRLCLED